MARANRWRPPRWQPCSLKKPSTQRSAASQSRSTAPSFRAQPGRKRKYARATASRSSAPGRVGEGHERKQDVRSSDLKVEQTNNGLKLKEKCKSGTGSGPFFVP